MSSITKVVLWVFWIVAVLGVIGVSVIALNFSDVKSSIGNALGQSGEAEMPEEDEELAALADPDSDEGFNVSDEASEDGLPSEREFADDLHHMTHQKVKASQKWGHLEITDERMEQMYETAEASDYTYKEFYMRVLEAWMEGDFSNAVQVHNTIWNEQNGNVGRAIGLLTPEEERNIKRDILIEQELITCGCDIIKTQLPVIIL